MVFQGEYLTVDSIDNSILELCFTSQGSVNKFNQATLKEFGQALNIISDQNHCQGLMLTTAKDNFIVGADITEFTALFKHPRAELLKWLSDANAIFNALEDLPFPTISVIQGYALGGGCECVLATDFRIADASAKIGLPETKLGLIPGFGGTVRLPRLIGADNALEWIATGREHRATECFKVGVLDALNETDQLKTAALLMLKSAHSGDLDWQKRRKQKKSPLLLDPTEAQMSFATAAAFVAQQVGPHYPAPMAAVRCVESAATQERPQALLCESEAFANLAPSQTANALIGLFLNDQYLKNLAKQASKNAPSTTDVAVIGAGIMGGGIAYQAAYCGKRVVMKDIQQKALDQGMQEAGKLLSNLLTKQKMSVEAMTHTLNQITPSLDQNAVRSSQVIIEAVVEKQDIKQQVLRELEDMTAANTILTSNTSTIPITTLAKALSRPQQFCGMHFFNPVHKMPLVEVIRGENTSQATIDAVVALAAAMRKSPIVVKDCPGFFVNRVLFPYLFALGTLIDEGVDYQFIDQVMEKQFGWPMGPAYLLDVIGLDTAKHAGSVMAKGFPDRMGDGRFNVVERLLENNCLGQKNGLGFYCYTPGKKGKPKKTPHLEIQQKLYRDTPSVIDADTVIARMMIPMLNEVARCLDEGIIDTPAQADMALVYGLGFPPFRGGACRYIDHTGVDNYVKLTERFSSLSPMYAPGEGLVAMARKNDSFYPDSVKGV